MKFKILLYAAAMLCGVSLLAQNNDCYYALSGKVLDSLTYEPLENSTVMVMGSNKTSIADKDGNFLIKGLCMGTYEIHVSHLSCEHFHFQITITKDTNITILLEHHNIGLKKFILTAPTSTTGAYEQHKLNENLLRKNRGISFSNVAANINGVNVLQTGSTIGKPVVNGLHGYRVVILNNGIRQEGQNWGLDHAPEIDPFAANEIELLNGIDWIRYGSDGIGGTLLLKNPSIFSETVGKLHSEIAVTGVSNGRGGSISFKTGTGHRHKNTVFYWRMHGTFKQTGNTKTPNYFIDNTGYKENNYSLHTGINKRNSKLELYFSSFSGKAGIFSGSHLGSTTDFYNAIQASKPLVQSGFSYQLNNPKQYFAHHLLKIKLSKQLNHFSNLNFIYGFQKNKRLEYDLRRGDPTLPSVSYSMYTHTLDFYMEKNKSHFPQIAYGLNFLYQGNTYSGRFFIPNFINRILGAFVTYKHNSGKWDTDAGLRADWRHLTAYFYQNNQIITPSYSLVDISGAATVGRKVGKQKGYFMLVLSKNWRTPMVNELYSDGLHHGASSLERGNPNLKAESAYKLSSAIKYSHSEKYTMELEVYSKYIRNFINLIPSGKPVLTIRGAFPEFVYTQTNAFLNGADANGLYKLNKNIALHFSCAVIFGYDISNKSVLNMVPAPIFKFAPEWKKGNKSIKVISEYTLKQNRYNIGSDIIPPPDAYFLLGAEFTYEPKFQHQNIFISLTVQNALNQSYRNYLNRFRYFTDETGKNLIIRVSIPIENTIKKIK